MDTHPCPDKELAATAYQILVISAVHGLTLRGFYTLLSMTLKFYQKIFSLAIP
jgi:glycosyltransferase A (GT-A) superfamily protein (DUF2064 family)